MKKNIWEKNIYSKKKQLNIFPFQELYLSLKKDFKKRSKTKFLEIGCGAGNNLIFSC